MSVAALMVAVETLKACSSLGSRLHARREHTDNLLFYPVRQHGLELLYQLRFESAVAVTWSGEFKITARGFDGFFGGTIAPVSFKILRQMGSQFGGQSSFS